MTAASSEVPRNWAVGLLGIYQKILNYARTRKTQTALTAIATLDRHHHYHDPCGLRPTETNRLQCASSAMKR